MGSKKDFVHLHVHSDSSQLDGCGKITDYVKKAKEMGHKALALTEHGSMRSYYNQQIECTEHGIKPLYGIELYMCNDMNRKGLTDEERQDIAGHLTGGAKKEAIKHYEEENGIRRRWHLTVWAKNKKGMENLYKLSSKSWIDGFYYKPRVDMDALIEHKEGLIVATGCTGSIINDHACCGQMKRAHAESDRLSQEFGEDLWLEVMPHDLDDQECTNRLALELLDRYEGKSRLVATQDAHYVDHTDWEAHEVLLCIGTNDHMDNPDRFQFGDGELYLKSRAEMYEAFKRRHGYMGNKSIKSALDNTLVLADSIEDSIVEIDRFKCLMPPIDVPSKYGDEFAFTKALCIHGWEWREIPKRAEYYAKRHGISYDEAIKLYKMRLKKELMALQKQKFIGYMLLVRDVYEWVRKQDIMCGPGRGSAAGSMVAFLLGITSVDPIEHNLLFERFINPNRVDPPDIDMDFEDARRQEIIEFLRQKYGEDKSSQIATVGKLSGKQCLKDVSRVLRVPYVEVNAITNSVVERSSGDERASQTIEDSFKDFDVCRAFDKKYPDVLKHAKVLEGMGKQLGIHAAGVVTSPVELSSIIPLETRKYDGRDVVVTAVDMYGAQAMGLLKLDVLGLRTLTVLKDACKAIRDRHGIEVDLEKLELNDPKVLQGFTDHEYVGIFQYDSPGADQICKGVQFESFEDVAAMTALNRPGTARSGLATQYVARKKNPKLRSEHPIHEAVSEVCSDTLGIIVYQEHVQRIFTDIAGFAPGTADSLRKKIAKKFGDEAIGKERANFIKGAKEKIGMDEKVAAKIMDAITFFGCLPKNSGVLTPWGVQQICKLKAGDSVCSRNESGELVPNVVKGVACSGEKTVYRVTTDKGSIRSSADHWWQTCDGGYVKTKDLYTGCVLSYVTDINLAANKGMQIAKVYYKRLRKESFSERVVFGSLSNRVSQKKDGRRHARWLGIKENRFARKRLEKGVGQESRVCACAIGSDKRKIKSVLAGRPRAKFQNCERKIVATLRSLSGMRQQTYFGTQSTEYEGVACSPYRQVCRKQRFGQSGSIVSKLSQFRAQERKSGRQTTQRVVSIVACEKEITWDLECVAEPRNYLVASENARHDFFVSHNSYGFNKSHATAYGIISYWGMWLKVYYPLEFYYALLKSEPMRQRIQNFAKDAKKHEIELLPPDVSMSREQFAIDHNRNAIRGSLVDIKGVGAAACATIVENQPFSSFADFLKKINKRKAHKGVVVALAKSGALDQLLPNIKAFVENVEEWWKKINNKGGMEYLEYKLEWSKTQDDYAQEERQLLASSVNPLAFGRHPIDAYKDFMEQYVPVETAMMSDEDFWDNNHDKSVYLPGVIVEVKYNQIGDFHTGAVPSERDRKLQFWGERYANVNVEDAGGTQNRVKFDIDIFSEHRELIDAGVGTPVIVHAVPNKKFENLRAHFAVDLEAYRKKVETGEPLNVWEQIVAGKHPAKQRIWKPTKKMDIEKVIRQRVSNPLFFKGKTAKFTGVVMQVRLKYDKNDNLMAFFSMIDGSHNAIDCICFSSAWEHKVAKVVKSGNFLSIELDRQKDSRNKDKWQYFFSGGKIHKYN